MILQIKSGPSDGISFTKCNKIQLFLLGEMELMTKDTERKRFFTRFWRENELFFLGGGGWDDESFRS
jgi:hypothetical protein